MDPIEKAIRAALEKGEAQDRAFREKVYRSAFAALDRAIQGNPSMTVENAIARRRALQAKIASIESEHLPAVQPASPPSAPAAPSHAAPPRPPADRSGGPSPAQFVEPSVARARPVPRPPEPTLPPMRATPAPPVAPASPAASSSPAEPVVPTVSLDPAAPRAPTVPPVSVGPAVEPPHAGAAPAVAIEPASGPVSAPALDPVLDTPAPRPRPRQAPAPRGERDERRTRRRFPVGGLLSLLVLAGAAGGGWWAWTSGLIALPETSAPRLDEGASANPADSGNAENWITVFTPSDLSLVEASAGAEAQVMESSAGSFLRIRSGGENQDVAVTVPLGVLQELAGRRAVFDIQARAEEGKDTQIAVDCRLGAGAECGRRRYDLRYEIAPLLFDVEVPAGQPTAPGRILIDSDFAGQGRAVDIFSIRVSAAD